MTGHETQDFMMADTAYQAVLYREPQGFMNDFRSILEERETENNLILGLNHCPVTLQQRYADLYYVALYQDKNLCGLAMRTPPHNLLLADIGVDIAATEALAYYAAEYLQILPGVLAEESQAEIFADVYARRKQVDAEVHMEQLIHELSAVNPDISCAPGDLKQASADDIPLLLHWMNEFQLEALHTTLSAEHQQRVLEDIQRGQCYLWVLPDGTPVSMLQKTRPTRQARCLSYVYTPPLERSKGYAKSAVTTLSKELLKTHAYCVLFTDKSNPTSNALYKHIGYQVRSSLRLYCFSERS